MWNLKKCLSHRNKQENCGIRGYGGGGVEAKGRWQPQSITEKNKEKDRDRNGRNTEYQ